MENYKISKLSKLRSYYVEEWLLDPLSIHFKLKFFKYNKYYQNRYSLKPSIYKNYKKNLNRTFIDIIPYKNREGIFINIRENEQNNFLIYFNNNTKPSKTNFITKEMNIMIIRIIIKDDQKNFSDLFNGCEVIKEINFKYLIREDIYDMSRMFTNCINLKFIKFDTFITTNVVNFSYMFYNCKSLKYLDLHLFSTSNAKNMEAMFYGCINLEVLDLYKFNFYTCEYLNYFLTNCYSLNTLVINKLNIRNNANHDYIFYGLPNGMVTNILNKFTLYKLKPE